MKTCKVLSLLVAGAFFFLLSCDDTHVFDNPNDSRADRYSPPATYVIPSASDTHLAKRDTLRVAVKDSANIFAFGRDSVAHDSIAAFRFQWKRSDSVTHDTIVATKGHAVGNVSIPVASVGDFSVRAIAKDTVGTWDTSSALSYVKVFRCRGVCLDTSLTAIRNGDTLSDTTLTLRWYHPMYDSGTDIKVDNVVRRSGTDTIATLKGVDGITWGRSGITKHNISFKAYAKGGKGVDTGLSLNFNVLPNPAFDSIPAKLWIVKNGNDTVVITKDTALAVLKRNFLVGAKLKYVNGMQALQVSNGVAQNNGTYSYAMAGAKDTLHFEIHSSNDSAISRYNVALTLSGDVNEALQLDTLKLNGASGTGAVLSPAFSKMNGVYNLAIARGDSVHLVWRKLLGYSTTQVNGLSDDSGTILVSAGKSVIPLVLANTVGSKVDSNIYRINIAWGKAHDPRLASFGNSSGVLSPSFSPDSLNYTLNLSSYADTVFFNPTALNGIRNIGYKVVAGSDSISASGVLILPKGTAVADIFRITNVSERGDSSKSYTVAVRRLALGDDAWLRHLSVDSGFAEVHYRQDSTIDPDSLIVVRSWAPQLRIAAVPNDSQASVFINHNFRSSFDMATAQNSDSLVSVSVRSKAQKDSSLYKVRVLRANDARVVFDTLWVDRGIVSPTYNYTNGKYAYNVIVNRGDTTKLHFRFNDTLNSSAWSPASNGTAYRSVYPVHGGNDTSVSMVATSKGTAVYNVYTIGIYSGDDTRLKSLAVTGQRSGILTPAFNPDSTKYALTVNAFDTTVNIAGATRCGLAKAYLGANSADSVTAQGIVHRLPARGSNVFDTVNVNVLGANGQTKGNYAIVIHRPLPSTNTALDTLTADSNFVTKVGTNSYVVKAVSKSLKLKAIPKDSLATVKIIDTTNDRTILTSISIDTNSKTKVYAVVTAQNGTDSATDTITVLRGNDARAMLDSIWVEHGTVSPTFNYLSGNYKYSLFVNRNDLAAKLRFKINDTTKTIGWSPVNNGKAYGSTYPLSVSNDTSVNMVVLGASSSLNLYAFNIYLRDDARLNALSVTGQSSGTLAPVFNPDSLKYTMTVGAADSVAALVGRPKATYGKASFNGDTAVMHSLTVPLKAGNDTLIVTSKAMDTTVAQTYRLIVTRPAALSNLGVSVRNPVSGTYTTAGFTSNFNGDSLSYVLSGTIPYATDSIRLFPVSYDTQNIVTIAGKTLKSKDSLAIGVPVKGDTIKDTVTVQSKDGKSTLKYSILVLRAASEKDSLLSGLTITGSNSGTLAVAFDSNATSYRGSHAVLAKFQDTVIAIKPATRSALAKILPDSIAFKHAGSSSFVGRVHAAGLSGISLLKVGDSTLKVGDSVMVTFTVVAEDTSIRRRDSVVLVRGADAVPPVAIFNGDTTYVASASDSMKVGWTVTDNDQLASVTIAGVAAVAGDTATHVYVATIHLQAKKDTICLVATDRTGNVTYDSIVVTRRDNTKPTATRGTSVTARTVAFDTTSVTLSWTVTDDNDVASVTVGGVAATQSNNVWTAKVPLAVGNDTIRMVGKDYAGNATNDSVVIVRAKDAIPPVATRSSTTKDTTIPYAATGYAVSWTVKDNDSTAPKVTINGTSVISSGSTYAATISAPHPKDSMWVILSAKDTTGNETRDSVKVHCMGPSSVATLSAVATTTGTMSPAINTADTSYTLTVDNAVSSVTLTPTVLDPTATTSTTKTIKLGDPGTTTMDSLIVTAQDGTVRKYHFSVVRSQAPLTLATSITSAVTLKGDSVYYISANTTVKTNTGILTIEPGARIVFDEGKTLVINNGGTIVARGTKGKPITFTKHGTNNWGYLNLNGATSATFAVDGSYANGSILENAVIEYSGNTLVSDNGALRITGCAPYLHNVTVSSSSSNGVDVFANDGIAMVVDTVTVADNAGDGWYGTSTEYNDGSTFRGCRALRNKRNGFNHLGYGVLMSDCRAEGNGLNGFDSIGTNAQMFRDTAMNNSGWGIYGYATTIDSAYVYGNVGGLYSAASTNVKNSGFIGNVSNAALYLTNGSVTNCRISGNVASKLIYISGGCYGVFVGNNISGNATQTAIDSGMYFNFGNCMMSSGYAMYGNRFDGNVFKGQGIYFANQNDSADTVIGNSAVGYVVYSVSSKSLHNIFYGNISTGGEILMMQNSTVTENLFDSNSVSAGHGVVGQSTGGYYIGSSSFTGNNFNNNYLLNADGMPYMLRNYFGGNSAYGTTVTATNNYWQTDDETVVPSLLYPSAVNVDASVGGINYSPYASDPKDNSGTPTWH